MYRLSARKRPFVRGHCGETVLWRILTIIKKGLKNWYVCTHRVCVPDPEIFGYLVRFWWKKNCTKLEHGEIMTCLILSGLVSQRKRLKLFHVIWKQPFPCQKIYLASQRNHEHHFILLNALYACEEVLQLWLESTSYIAGNSSTNLLARHIYYHLYPQYIRHHFWRRRCMKRTLVCAFAVTRDKKNYNEKQAYRNQHH